MDDELIVGLIFTLAYACLLARALWTTRHKRRRKTPTNDPTNVL